MFNVLKWTEFKLEKNFANNEYRVHVVLTIKWVTLNDSKI